MRTGAAVGAGFSVLGEGDLDTLASPFRAQKWKSCYLQVMSSLALGQRTLFDAIDKPQKRGFLAGRAADASIVFSRPRRTFLDRCCRGRKRAFRRHCERSEAIHLAA